MRETEIEKINRINDELKKALIVINEVIQYMKGKEEFDNEEDS